MKTIKNITKIQIAPGKATPAPPIGPSLGQQGINILSFCKEFNDKSKNFDTKLKVQVVITIYSDKTFSFIIKQPTVSSLIKKKLNIKKASNNPGKTDAIARISKLDIENIAKIKITEMNVYDINTAIKVIKGTIQSMGIEIEQ